MLWSTHFYAFDKHAMKKDSLVQCFDRCFSVSKTSYFKYFGVTN